MCVKCGVDVIAAVAPCVVYAAPVVIGTLVCLKRRAQSGARKLKNIELDDLKYFDLGSEGKNRKPRQLCGEPRVEESKETHAGELC